MAPRLLDIKLTMLHLRAAPRQAMTGGNGARAQSRRPSEGLTQEKPGEKKAARVLPADRFLIRLRLGYLAADRVQGVRVGQGFSALSMPQS